MAYFVRSFEASADVALFESRRNTSTTSTTYNLYGQCAQANVEFAVVRSVVMNFFAGSSNAQPVNYISEMIQRSAGGDVGLSLSSEPTASPE